MFATTSRLFRMGQRLALGFSLATLLAFSATAKDVTYSNPVMPGDFPDPSVIRVGNDYWATATSSEWGPLFPILHSTDLVNWELAGHVFDKKPAWSTQNYWAPEISVFKGQYYIYYVARQAGTNGVLHVAVATADQPAGPWTDHGPLIGQPEGSIDGMAFTTDDGERYLIWKNDGNSRNQPTMIWAQKLSDDGTKLVGEMKELLRNDSATWEGNLIEGPFIKKHGEVYYLFYSGAGCCGSGCSYGLGVARANNLLGPYEKNPANPIVFAGEKWKCPGHGSMVGTPDGRDYFLYHAYDTQASVYVGRQGVLDLVTWLEDGWPSLSENKVVSTNAPSPLGKAQKIELAFEDDFSASKLNPHWQWPHSIVPKYTLENRQLHLVSNGERGTNLFGSVVAVHTTTADYAATTLIEAGDLKSGARAGLFAFGDSHNALGVALGDHQIKLIRTQRSKQEVLATVDAPKAKQIYLRTEVKDGHRFSFFTWNGKDWTSIGSADLEGNYLPPWDRGVRIALTVGGNDKATAKFDWLRVIPKGMPDERPR